MIAFAFGEPKDPLDSSETAEMLMMKLLMIAIENERLSAENYCRSITQDSALSKYGREKEAGYQTFRVSDK